MRAVTRVADDATAALDLNDVARGDGVPVRPRRRRARRPRRRRARRRPTRPPDSLPRSTTTNARGDRRRARSPSAGCRSTRRPRRAGRARRSPCASAPTAAAWSRRSTAPPSSSPAPQPPQPVGGGVHDRAGDAGRRYLAAVAAARDAVRAGRADEGRDRPRDRRHRRPADRPPRRAAPAEGVVRVELPLLRRRVDRRLARAARRGRRPRRCARTRWPAPRRAPATSTATPRSPPQLVASTKNQVEHRVVIDVVHDTLLPWCSFLDWEPDPSIVTVANVQHLGTRIEGQLSSPPPNVLELVRALSPTPALGGHPRDAALALIAAVEGVDRGRYGGAVGWVDAAGNGTWAVAHPLRRAVRRPAPGPPARRRRHRRRQRSARRAGRDPGQVPGDAVARLIRP